MVVNGQVIFYESHLAALSHSKRYQKRGVVRSAAVSTETVRARANDMANARELKGLAVAIGTKRAIAL